MPSDEDYAAMAACGQKIIGRCTVCDLEFYAREAIDDHVKSETHKQNVLKNGIVIY